MEDLKHFMVKGSPMLADMVFIRDRHGEDGLQQVFDAMPPEVAQEYRKKLLASSWYTMEFRIHLLTAVNKVFAKGNMDYFWELGCHQAEHNIKNYYKTFMRMVGPKRIMSMAPLFWGLIYKSSHIELKAEEKLAEVKVFDYPKAPIYNCQVVRGYLHRTAEIAGDEKNNVRSTEPTCLNRGDQQCCYLLQWD